MILGLYEAHLPVRNLNRSIEFYEGLGLQLDHKVDERIAFLWIEKDKSWLGLWETERVNEEYHPSLRHIAFHVSLEGLKNSVEWLKQRGCEPREAFGFKGTEPFVMPHQDYAHAKIHFNDPDGNSLELICKMNNPKNWTERMYLSEWERKNN
ncbi:VOC family protein [Metabacillus sp. GX 13764]|uniref:VOC family protein n=1 Tax=Metabacillus kandeliae TaxID=2900151 RepID=UPI001E59C4C3|nr:VOC family protein [Metabacillus kandeliae]MCD7034353.1 VOC family protein [Metabacillus kandeliae]